MARLRQMSVAKESRLAAGSLGHRSWRVIRWLAPLTAAAVILLAVGLWPRASQPDGVTWAGVVDRLGTASTMRLHMTHIAPGGPPAVTVRHQIPADARGQIERGVHGL